MASNQLGRRTIRRLTRWLAALMVLHLADGNAIAVAAPAGIPPGDARQVAVIANVELTVFTYRPPGCQPRLLLLVFHGTERRAAAYREHARPLADQVCSIVLAPEFERAQFPRPLYQYGGIVGEAAGDRTVDLVPALLTWYRTTANQSDLPFVLLGHSAGAQFLGRVAAFVPTGAAGIILANPSTWVLPSTTTAAPYGFGATTFATDDAVRAYLAQPVTILLGTADTGSKELATSQEAMAQGPNRYTRGMNTFRMAQQVARSHGWRFGWTLSEVPGVGHDAAAMFGSPQALKAVQRAVPAGR